MIDISMVIYRPNEKALRQTFNSLREARDEFRLLRILVSGENADAELVDRLLDAASLRESCTVSRRFDNLGFASGHNKLLREAFEHGASATLVLNPDVQISPGALSRFALLARDHGQLALYGPALMRTSDRADDHLEGPSVVDSLGIAWSTSGRHFDRAQGNAWQIKDGSFNRVDGLTGACLYVSAAAYERLVTATGWFFDDLFLAYREDAELGIRAAAVGVGSWLVELDGFSHVRSVRGYQRGNPLTDLLGVRNRFILRWRLGSNRPGNAAISGLRDLVVIAASVTVERSSLPGLVSAFRIRRFAASGRIPRSH
jgi:GT2 family glycosyltransferase